MPLQGSDGVVPVYHFGNTSLLDIFPQGAEKISRRMRAGMPGRKRAKCVCARVHVHTVDRERQLAQAGICTGYGMTVQLMLPVFWD